MAGRDLGSTIVALLAVLVLLYLSLGSFAETLVILATLPGGHCRWYGASLLVIFNGLRLLGWGETS